IFSRTEEHDFALVLFTAGGKKRQYKINQTFYIYNLQRTQKECKERAYKFTPTAALDLHRTGRQRYISLEPFINHRANFFPTYIRIAISSPSVSRTWNPARIRRRSLVRHGVAVEVEALPLRVGERRRRLAVSAVLRRR